MALGNLECYQKWICESSKKMEKQRPYSWMQMIIQWENGQPINSIKSHIWEFPNIEFVPLQDITEFHSFMKQSPEAATYNTLFAIL